MSVPKKLTFSIMKKELQRREKPVNFEDLTVEEKSERMMHKFREECNIFA